MPLPVTIIIADDHKMYRSGLRDLLTAAGMKVVALVANGAELIEAAKQHRPDIVFIDIRMPGMDGMDACMELTVLFPHIGKIAITYHDTCHPDVYRMSLAGATGFLSKQSDQDEIIRCVNTVYNGGSHCDEKCRLALKDQFNLDLQKHGLTEKDLELLILIAEEKSTVEIAELMHQSTHTIEKWRPKLYEKCEVKTAVGLIKFGVKWRIIKIEE